MAKAISVRLDDETERALRTLESSGLSQSEAIRSSLLASVGRLRRGRELAAEAAALEADETDRAEMASVAALMESMRAASQHGERFGVVGTAWSDAEVSQSCQCPVGSARRRVRHERNSACHSDSAD